MNVNKCVVILTIMLNFTCVGALHAEQEVQNFGRCLVDSMTGKERKDLAKWIYFAMSAHSTIRPYSNISQTDIDQSNKFVGALVTRLITKDCPEQARAADAHMGAAAFEQAFKIVGEVAMQELMMEPSVGETISGFENYLDESAFEETFQ